MSFFKIKKQYFLILSFLRTINEIIDQTVSHLLIESKIHENLASKLTTSIVEEIRLIYSTIAEGKKKYMKVLNKEIIKETNDSFAKIIKQQKKDKPLNFDPLDIKNLKTTLQIEFQERNAESNKAHKISKNFRGFRNIRFSRKK